MLLRLILHHELLFVYAVAQYFESLLVSLEGLFFLKVRPVAEDEMFKVIRSGKRKSKHSTKFFTFYMKLFLLDICDCT